MRNVERSQAILERLREFSLPERPIYMVGGAVRDQLLQRPLHDLDFVLSGSTRPVARAIADAFDGGFYVLDAERDTSRVVLPPTNGSRLVVDFAVMRGQSLEEDLRSRDFTLNALAYEVNEPGRLIDPLGGLADLQAGVVRACSSASLESDPVRVLRAVRLAVSMQFRIDPGTLHLVRTAVPLLGRVSPERQRDELFRMLAGRRVTQAVQILDHVGALGVVLPELAGLKGVRQSVPHVWDVWEHTLAVIGHLERLFDALVGDYDEDAVADLISGLAVLRLGRYRTQLERHFALEGQPDRPERALLFFAALYHDIAKPAARSVKPSGRVRFIGHADQGAVITAERARALALSGDEVERSAGMVRHHMRIHHLAEALPPAAAEDGRRAPSRRALYRFFRDTGSAGVDLCLLALADTRATYEVTLPQSVWLAELDVCRALLEAYWENSDAVVSPPRLLNGNEVMKAFHLKPGPQVGELLEAVREGQAAGEITSREEAFDFARRWLEGHEEQHEIEEEG